MANLINLGNGQQKDGFIVKLTKSIQSSHVNFLLGSGCSLPGIKTLGNIEKAYTDYIENNQQDLANKLLFEFLRAFLMEPSEWKDISKPDTKETLANYKHFLENVSHLLTKRKNGLLQKRATIFTTNYDLFIEGAFEDINTQIHLIDGFKRSPGLANSFKFSPSEFFNTLYNDGNLYNYKVEIPTINLIKLHGSMNWKVNQENIINSVEHFGKLKIKHEELLKSGDVVGMAEFNKKISVVLPRKEKFKDTLLDQNYYDLLRLYANELDKENTLLIVNGFSFADEHICEITKRALKNPTLLLVIFSFNKSDKDNFERIFFSNKNVDVVFDENKSFQFNEFAQIIGGI